MRTGIEICSVHSVRTCAQISSRWASTVLGLFSLTLIFIQALLASFPEPLMNCSDALAENLRRLDPEAGGRPDAIWAGPRNQDDAMALVPLVEPLYERPQGEMLRALCDSLVPVFRAGSQIPRELISEIFSELLTRKGVSSTYSLILQSYMTLLGSSQIRVSGAC